MQDLRITTGEGWYQWASWEANSEQSGGLGKIQRRYITPLTAVETGFPQLWDCAYTPTVTWGVNGGIRTKDLTDCEEKALDI